MTEGLYERTGGVRGELDVFSPASPAAGANLAFTIGSLNVVRARIIACKATLTTDANVANRTFALDYIGSRSGSNIRHSPTAVYTANTAATAFQWDHAHAASEWAANTIVYVPLTDVYLKPGWSVQLTVDNVQAGDQISAISFVVEKFYADS